VPKETNMREAWEKFDRGDHLTTPELRKMAVQGRQAEKFLADRGETGGVLFKLRLNLNAIEGYLYERAKARKE